MMKIVYFDDRFKNVSMRISIYLFAL